MESRKQAQVEEELRRHKEELQAIFDSSPEMIFYKDKNNRFIRVNNAFVELVGQPKESIEGKTAFELYPKNAERYWLDDKEVMASGKPKINFVESIETDKGVRWLQTTKVAYKDSEGNIIGIIGFSLDITERKESEEKVLESNDYLNAIINALADPIFVKDSEFKFTLVNDALCKFVGRSRQEFIGQDGSGFFPKEQMDVFLRMDKQVFDTGQENINEENITDALGRVNTIVTKKTLYVDKKGRKFLVGIIRDLTERKLAEDALRESEERHRVIFNGSRDALMILEPPMFRFTSGNPAALELYGVKSLSDFVALGPWDVSPDKQPDGQSSLVKAKEMIDKAMREGSNYFEWVHKRTDGKEFPCVVLLTTLKTQGKTIIQATVRDITDRKKMEIQISRMNQMQSALFEPATLQEKLDMITRHLVSIFEADFARIWFVVPGDKCDSGCIHAQVKDGPHLCLHRDKCLKLMSSAGRYPHLDGGMHSRVPYGCYKIGCIASGEYPSFLTNDVTHDPRVHNHDWARQLGLVSFAGYQLRSPDGKILGVIAFFCSHTLSPEEYTLFEVISKFSVRVIEMAKVDEETQKNLHDLAVFYQASIGREERILELKRRIAELEAKAGK